MSSTPTATDGFLYGWIDGNLKWSNPAYATGNTGGWYDFQTPTVFNQGLPESRNPSGWMNLTVWEPIRTRWEPPLSSTCRRDRAFANM